MRLDFEVIDGIVKGRGWKTLDSESTKTEIPQREATWKKVKWNKEAGQTFFFLFFFYFQKIYLLWIKETKLYSESTKNAIPFTPTQWVQNLMEEQDSRKREEKEKKQKNGKKKEEIEKTRDAEEGEEKKRNEKEKREPCYEGDSS